MSLHCSECGANGNSDFMSNSQRKKTAEKRRCILCVQKTLTDIRTTTANVSKSEVIESLSKSSESFPSDNFTSKKRKIDDVENTLSMTTPNQEKEPLQHITVEDKSYLQKRKDLLSRLRLFYCECCPSRCNQVKSHNRLLDKYEGKEEVLFAKLKLKYENKMKTSKTIPSQNEIKRQRSYEEHKEEQEDHKEEEKHESKYVNPTLKTKDNIKCDKCDGKHPTEKCPHFKKSREKHPDAQKRKAGADIGSSGGNVVAKSGKVISQPGDGSCLFHSMNFGLSRVGVSSGSATSLRRDIARFLSTHPTMQISDTPVSNWIKWDSGMNVHQYCSRMSRGGWGGGIELAGCSILKKVNVHVYERLRGGRGLKRISCFNSPGSKQTIYVLYCGGMHYDALLLDPQDIQRISNHSTDQFQHPHDQKSSYKNSKVQFKNKRNSYGLVASGSASALMKDRRHKGTHSFNQTRFMKNNKRLRCF